MKNFSEASTLGRTGLKVGRLGISSSYGAPASAFEEAFERGCNYFVMGSFMKGRSKEMITAIRNISKRGDRDKLVVCMMGARNLEMMRENLETLDSGPLSTAEMERIRRIGDHVYGKPRS